MSEFKVDERAAAVAAELNKKFGEGLVMVASQMRIPVRFTTGSLSLDVALGGGLPGNQWVEIYGPENHGKTAITLKTVAANQALNPNHFTLWIASEHYDLDQAEALGVDTDRVHVVSTRDMAFAYDIVIKYLENRACDMVVIDSYPALIGPDEDAKDMDEYTQAEGAKMTNKFFRKVGKAGLRNALDPNDRPFVGIFINQPREKIGGWVPAGAKNETTPGGRGKNFAFYARLDVARAEWIEEGTERSKTKVGQVIRVRMVKNKGGPPQRTASIDFYFTDAANGHRRGEYDLAKDVLTMAVLFDVVHKGGSWYTFEDRQWQGLRPLLDSMREEPDLMSSVEKRTREVALNPQDKRTWTEAQVESASAAKTTLRRQRGKA